MFNTQIKFCNLEPTKHCSITSYICFSMENFRESCFFLSMEGKKFLQPGAIFVEVIVIFYWVNGENQDCFRNPSPHP